MVGGGLRQNGIDLFIWTMLKLIIYLYIKMMYNSNVPTMFVKMYSCGGSGCSNSLT